MKTTPHDLSGLKAYTAGAADGRRTALLEVADEVERLSQDGAYHPHANAALKGLVELLRKRAGMTHDQRGQELLRLALTIEAPPYRVTLHPNNQIDVWWLKDGAYAADGDWASDTWEVTIPTLSVDDEQLIQDALRKKLNEPAMILERVHRLGNVPVEPLTDDELRSLDLTDAEQARICLEQGWALVLTDQGRRVARKLSDLDGLTVIAIVIEDASAEVNRALRARIPRKETPDRLTFEARGLGGRTIKVDLDPAHHTAPKEEP